MRPWIGTAILTGALILGGTTAMVSNAQAANRAATTFAAQSVAPAVATDFSSRHRTRQPHRYAYRPNFQPAYYDRPTYYRPYPYQLPLPFFLGFGYGPWW